MRAISLAILAAFALPSQTLACQSYDLEGLGQNWAQEDAAAWYGLSQGSRLMRLDWYRALPAADGSGAYASRDRLENMGFLFCDADATDPIGFVVDADTARAPAMGLTCAACHTGVLDDGTQRYIVHGGAAMMDLQGFMTGLVASAEGLWRDGAQEGAAWLGFAKAVLPDNTPESRVALRAELGDWLQFRTPIQDSVARGGAWGYGRQDAVQVILNTTATLSGLRAGDVLPASSAPVSIPHVWYGPRSDRVQWNGSSFKSVDLGLWAEISSGALIRNIAEVIGVFADVTLPPAQEIGSASYPAVQSSVRVANMVYLERALGTLDAPRWHKAWGLPDAAQVARGEVLYNQHCAACHAVIDRDAPPARIIDATSRDPGTEVFSRMIPVLDMPGQPIPGIGTDPMNACNAATHTSWSGRMAGLTNVFNAAQGYRREGISGLELARHPPGSETLRLIEDLSLRVLYEKRGEIADVHKADLTRRASAMWDDLASLPVRGGEWIFGQEAPDTSPRPGTHGLQTLEEVEARCRDALAEQRLRAPHTPDPAYRAAPLSGIFASAPYLHNGSVPTLDDLLRPVSERPTRFAVGQVLFDPVKVGTGAPVDGGAWSWFDVTDDTGRVIPGNSNRGHEFPVGGLSDQDRAALVAYLRGL